jgi:hypothetical protein
MDKYYCLAGVEMRELVRASGLLGAVNEQLTQYWSFAFGALHLQIHKVRVLICGMVLGNQVKKHACSAFTSPSPGIP